MIGPWLDLTLLALLAATLVLLYRLRREVPLLAAETETGRDVCEGR